MNTQQLIFTKEDAERIVNEQIVEHFYMMYKGSSVNDAAGYAQRQNKLQQDYVMVLKAFFVPPHVLAGMPTDTATANAQKDMMMLHEGVSSDAWVQKTNIERVHVETISQIAKFNGLKLEDLEQAIPLYGFGRRLSILEKYFQVRKELILRSLHALCLANNGDTKKYRKYEEETNIPIGFSKSKGRERPVSQKGFFGITEEETFRG